MRKKRPARTNPRIFRRSIFDEKSIKKGMRKFVSKNDDFRRKSGVKKKEESKSVGRAGRGKKVFLKKG